MQDNRSKIISKFTKGEIVNWYDYKAHEAVYKMLQDAPDLSISDAEYKKELRAKLVAYEALHKKAIPFRALSNRLERDLAVTTLHRLEKHLNLTEEEALYVTALRQSIRAYDLKKAKDLTDVNPASNGLGNIKPSDALKVSTECSSTQTESFAEINPVLTAFLQTLGCAITLALLLWLARIIFK